MCHFLSVENIWMGLFKEIGFDRMDIRFDIIPINKRSVSEMEMYKVNSIFPHLLARICLEKNTYLIQPTTDCVFDGLKKIKREHTSLDDYGLSKSLGEPMNERTCIIRVSIIGEEINKRSLIEWVKNNKGRDVMGYINHKWNGITCLQYTKEIERILKGEIVAWNRALVFESRYRKNKWGNE